MNLNELERGISTCLNDCISQDEKLLVKNYLARPLKGGGAILAFRAGGVFEERHPEACPLSIRNVAMAFMKGIKKGRLNHKGLRFEFQLQPPPR